MKRAESKVPFVLFVLSKEKIRETYKMPARAKLQWLEEANEFFAKVKKEKQSQAKKVKFSRKLLSLFLLS